MTLSGEHQGLRPELWLQGLWGLHGRDCSGAVEGWWVVGKLAPRPAFAGCVATRYACFWFSPSFCFSFWFSPFLFLFLSVFIFYPQIGMHMARNVKRECLEDLKIEWVLLGHSERREYFLESNELLAQKLCHGDRLLWFLCGFPWDVFLAFKRSINMGSFPFCFLTSFHWDLLTTAEQIFCCSFFFGISALSIWLRKYVLDAGMKCVYAIGEKLPDREKGLEATMAVCIDQLAQVKSLLDPEKARDLGSSSSRFQSS